VDSKRGLLKFAKKNLVYGWVSELTVEMSTCRVRLKPDGTWWRTRGEVKGKLANGVGSQYSSHYLGTWCTLMHTLGCQQSTELTPPPI